jgi:Cu(I)/Ag(I) efflux system membrane fusion protein
MSISGPPDPHAHGAAGPVSSPPPSPPRPMSRWKKFRLVIKVVELRLRFIALLAATGLVFAYWDTIWNRYDKWRRPDSSHQHAAASGVEYYCPMHPQVIRDEPGSCPICGMPLSKRKKGEKESLPEGVAARVSLAPFRVKQAGVQTVEVSYTPLEETLTTVGTVEFDERNLKNIASKVRGMARVEKLFVNFTGVDVAAGGPLAELYGAELYQAVRELLLASRRAASPAARGVGVDSQELVHLSSEKLKLMGVTQEQIDDILRKGTADFKLPIVSPIGGHVVKKDVVEGQFISEGQTMFEVADLHTVWVKAQVYEDQIGLVHVGQSVEASVSSFPGRTFPGKVAFIQPHLDPQTRTVEVRYDLDNPGHELRPGMFATVTLRTPVADTPMFRGKLAASRPADGAVRLAGSTAAEQKACPVTGAKLGSMGEPVPVEIDGKKTWTCCDACPPKLKADPKKYLAKLQAAPPPRDSVLSVPEVAVIDTGAVKLVYVETGPGVYEGRRVVLGPRSGDRFPVLDGLNAGEKVVAAGAFLVDAESRLNPATRGGASGGETPPASPGVGKSVAVAPGHAHRAEMEP